jgi:hypothetical protein
VFLGEKFPKLATLVSCPISRPSLQIAAVWNKKMYWKNGNQLIFPAINSSLE